MGYRREFSMKEEYRQELEDRLDELEERLAELKEKQKDVALHDDYKDWLKRIKKQELAIEKARQKLQTL